MKETGNKKPLIVLFFGCGPFSQRKADVNNPFSEIKRRFDFIPAPRVWSATFHRHSFNDHQAIPIKNDSLLQLLLISSHFTKSDVTDTLHLTFNTFNKVIVNVSLSSVNVASYDDDRSYETSPKKVFYFLLVCQTKSNKEEFLTHNWFHTRLVAIRRLTI